MYVAKMLSIFLVHRYSTLPTYVPCTFMASSHYTLYATYILRNSSTLRTSLDLDESRGGFSLSHEQCEVDGC